MSTTRPSTAPSARARGELGHEEPDRSAIARHFGELLLERARELLAAAREAARTPAAGQEAGSR